MDEAPLSLSKKLSLKTDKASKLCVIHDSSVHSSDVRPLTNASYFKIQEIANQKAQASSTSPKFHQICDNIPITIDYTKHGFHRECYKRLTNVKNVNKAQKRKSSTEFEGPSSQKKCHPPQSVSFVAKRKNGLRKKSVKEPI